MRHDHSKAGLSARLPPMLILLGHAWLARQGDLSLHVPGLVLVSALQCVVLALALYLMSTARKGLEARLEAREIFLWALAFRLLYLPGPPTLSDDIYRYLWDGHMTASGHNPYTLPPAAFAETRPPGLEAVLLGVNHPSLVTIYPPGAQFIFALSHILAPGLMGMKALIICFDMGIIALLLRLCPVPSAVLLYAWHPLSVIESACSGHIEPAAIFFLVLGIFLSERLRPAVAGMAAGMAVMTKIVPVIFIPLIAKRLAQRSPAPAGGKKAALLFISTAACLCLALLLPFSKELPHLLVTLKTYALNWEFSSFPLLALRTVAGPMQTRFMLYAALAAALALIYVSRIPLAESLQLTALAFLLTSPTLHPWYALPFLAFLPLRPHAAGLAFSWSILLSYRVLINYSLTGTWKDDPATAMVIFLAGTLSVAVLIVSLRHVRAARNKAC